jgi:hypothetical protein
MKQLPFSIVKFEYFTAPFLTANFAAAEFNPKDSDTI